MQISYVYFLNLRTQSGLLSYLKLWSMSTAHTLAKTKFYSRIPMIR